MRQPLYGGFIGGSGGVDTKMSRQTMTEQSKGGIVLEKICPVLATAEHRGRCLGERCAWWDEHYNCCAELSSAILLEVLVKRKTRFKTPDELNLTRDTSQKNSK